MKWWTSRPAALLRKTITRLCDANEFCVELLAETLTRFARRWGLVVLTAVLIATGVGAAGGAGILFQAIYKAAGGTSRTAYSKLSDVVSVKDFCGDTIPTDATTCVQAAITAACASGLKSVFIPGATYKISSTLTGCGSLKLHGDRDSTVLRPTITDASPVLNFPAGSGNFEVEDISITSGINTTNFQAGTASAQQCTGIKVTSANPTYSSRFTFKNIRVEGVKVAYDIQGFIVTFDHVVANYNEIGFKGDTMNAAELTLRLENNRQDLALTNSSGVKFNTLLMEAGNANAIASTIDSSNGVVISGCYFETNPSFPRAVPILSVGVSSAVTQFKMQNCSIAGSSGMTTGTYPISLDQVTGADINAHFATGSQLRKVLTTANTTDYRLTGDDSTGWFTDESKQIGPAFNYWPNRNFDLWFRGWTTVTPTRATITQETTTVRKGANAMRVSATAANAFNVAEIQITGPAVTALRSKTVRLGAWIFVPNITEYDESNRTAFPGIIAETFNGASVLSTTANTSAARNAWNYFTATVTMQAAATQFNAYFYANQSATNATGNEYIIVGSVTLVEASTPIAAQMNDSMPDSPLVQSIGVNGNLVSYGTASPTDTNQSFLLGDMVLKSNASAAVNVGWICTTAGSPGTWTTFPGPRGRGALTYSGGGNGTPDITHNFHTLTMNAAGGYTVNNTSGAYQGMLLTIWVSNTSGGVLGTVTMGNQYQIAGGGTALFSGAGANAPPATTFNRSVTFAWQDSAAKWYEVARSVADAPN